MNGFVCKLLPFSAAFAVTLSLHAAAPTDFAKTITGTAPAGLLLSGGTLPAADGGLRLVAPAEGAVVPLLNETQKAFLALPCAERVAAFADEAFRRELKERGGARPAPVRLEWEGEAPGGVGSVFSVEVRRLPDGTPVFRADTTAHSVELDNLEIGREYAWSVHARGIGVADATGRFRTEDRALRDRPGDLRLLAGDALAGDWTVFRPALDDFDRWPGDSINERVEAYVLSLGFTPVDLAAFRNLLLEPVPCDALP